MTFDRYFEPESKETERTRDNDRREHFFYKTAPFNNNYYYIISIIRKPVIDVFTYGMMYVQSIISSAIINIRKSVGQK